MRGALAARRQRPRGDAMTLDAMPLRSDAARAPTRAVSRANLLRALAGSGNSTKFCMFRLALFYSHLPRVSLLEILLVSSRAFLFSLSAWLSTWDFTHFDSRFSLYTLLISPFIAPLSWFRPTHLRTSVFTIFTYLFPPLHLALRPPFSPRLSAVMQSPAAVPIGRCFLGPLWNEMRARRNSLLLLSPCYRLSSLITREHLLCCEIRTGRTLSRSESLSVLTTLVTSQSLRSGSVHTGP